MNINDVESLVNMIRYTVGESARIKAKGVRLLQEVGGGKFLSVTFDVETLNGRDELSVVAAVSRHILRDDNSGISSYFPIVVEAAKKKVAELHEMILARERWISLNYPTVSGALQAYSAMGGVYRTEYLGCATDAECPVMVTLDPGDDCVPLILRVPKGENRMHEMVALSSIIRHIERRNEPSAS